MDDGEGAMSFDFEGGLDMGPSGPTASLPVVQAPAIDTNGALTAAAGANMPFTASGPSGQAADGMAGGGRRSFRQTVCRHWLRSLCMKGDACGFLHQYDKSRMPVCRFFRLYGECREQDCVYKHTNEDIKECNMYKLGFCPNGPDCRYRHAKLPGPPPPVEEVLQKIQQLNSNNYGSSNKFFPNRNAGYNQQSDKPQFPQVQNGANQPGKSITADSANVQQSQQMPQPQQHSSQSQIQAIPSNPQNQAGRVAAPLPQGTSRYFVVKSCNRENLELSVQQGVWATQRSNEAKLNGAFESVENVILIFSVNKTRHFQGCAKMTSKIGGFIGGGNWKHAHGTAQYGRNFAVKWLKLSELSFDKTRHLRNPYNENLPVKISRDCQELEPTVGEQLASLLYLEPDSDLMALLVAAEAKREPENARGAGAENATEDPDIVPFEDNEEDDEEEEESEDEEENSANAFGPQGRGRQRGMMWPHAPLGRGGPPFPGFPPNIIGDGFSYGPPFNPDGFPMADPFGMAPRSFGHYRPRFPTDFAGSAQMMFPGRPGPGFGMVMGPGRGHFMDGARPFYHQGPPPPLPPHSQYSNRAEKDQRQPSVDRNHGSRQEIEDGAGSEGARRRARHNDGYSGGGGYKREESESEDEAPRRSRHGEGKRKSRSLEMEAQAVSADAA